MFCRNCGKEIVGRYCSYCGIPIVKDKIRDYDSYSALISDDRCKRIIASEAMKGQSGMSADEFLKLASKIIPTKLPMELMGNMGKEFWTSLGLKTGKKKSITLPYCYAYALLATLCSLARHKMTLQSISEAKGLCGIEATLPSSVWSWEGKINIAIRSQGDRIEIHAETIIPGQYFDWGKSQRALDALFNEIKEFTGKFVNGDIQLLVALA